MSLRVYNTLTRSKEVFEPVKPGRVGMYLCGPTVYKSPHIGHMVGPIIFDAIKRYLKFKGFEVTWVVNITDVDDKLIDAARRRNTSVNELAERYTREYLDVLRRLGVNTIDKFPRVSDHIPQIISMISKLKDRGFAYESEGTVWFDVTRDKDYGKLSGRKVEDQNAGSRDLEGRGKRNAADFALWKSPKSDDEPAWDSPFGRGRPGWHIECSAMSIEYLGETFDIHGGGDDLKFPHHENELAQAECATGKPFARYWLHNGLTKFNTKKISGSDFENATSEEVRKIQQSVDANNLIDSLGPALFRYLILSTHYRSPIDFGEEVVNANRKGLASLQRVIERATRIGVVIDDQSPDVNAASRTMLDGPADTFIRTLLALKMRFLESMDDDFNTAGAIATLHEIASATNQYVDANKLEVTPDDTGRAAVTAAVVTLTKLAAILGLDLQPSPAKANDDLSDKLMQLIIELRKEARESKNFALADSIRTKLAAIGVSLEDGKAGTIWRREK